MTNRRYSGNEDQERTKRNSYHRLAMIEIGESCSCLPPKLCLLSLESVNDNRKEISVEILRRYLLKVNLVRGKIQKLPNRYEMGINESF